MTFSIQDLGYDNVNSPLRGRCSTSAHIFTHIYVHTKQHPCLHLELGTCRVKCWKHDTLTWKRVQSLVSSSSNCMPAESMSCPANNNNTCIATKQQTQIDNATPSSGSFCNERVMEENVNVITRQNEKTNCARQIDHWNDQCRQALVLSTSKNVSIGSNVTGNCYLCAHS